MHRSACESIPSSEVEALQCKPFSYWDGSEIEFKPKFDNILAPDEGFEDAESDFGYDTGEEDSESDDEITKIIGKRYGYNLNKRPKVGK